MKLLQERNLQTVHDMWPDCDDVCCYHMVTGMISKMTGSDVLCQKRTVIEFIVKEEKICC